MQLQSLELSGFKSFAKKTVLTFDAPITAIVGPNGSGKSNVAEAFRWVLGEQSLKTLRGKRGEDLIFNGSGSAPRQSRASVTLTFDNRDRILPLEFDEVMITREVHTDGVNDYFLNRSKVRLKDIVELLASVGLGSTSHHIISQGEADRILRASPRERESMIEEALSLTVYHLKIAESEKKLEKTQENLRQVDALRKEIAPHLKFLGKQMEKLRQAEDVRRELTTLYQNYLANEEVYLQREKETIESARREPLSALSEIEEKLKEAETLLSREERGESDDEQALTELRREITAAEAERGELARKLGRVEGMIEVRSEAVDADSAEGDVQIPLSRVRELTTGITKSLAAGEESMDSQTLKQVLADIRERITSFLHRFAGAAEERRHALSELRREKETLERALGTVLTREEELRAEADTLRTRITESESQLREQERALYDLKSRRSELRQELETLSLKKAACESAERDFKLLLEEARILIGREALNYSREESAELEGRDAQEARRKQIDRLRFKLEDLGAGGEDIAKEYGEVSERDSYLARELEDLRASEQSLHQVLRELEETLEHEFHEGIEKINAEFQNFFSLMFGGGTASIFVIKAKRRKQGEEEVAEGEEETGIDISVSLPRKKIRGIHMLSGGERALTSIALLFAISQVNPPPFLILDETDAALDEANSRRYGDMIENLSKFSQLIVITHNRETMSRAGILYGVTMTADSISKLLSIRFDEATAVAK